MRKQATMRMKQALQALAVLDELLDALPDEDDS